MNNGKILSAVMILCLAIGCGNNPPSSTAGTAGNKTSKTKKDKTSEKDGSTDGTSGQSDNNQGGLGSGGSGTGTDGSGTTISGCFGTSCPTPGSGSGSGTAGQPRPPSNQLAIIKTALSNGVPDASGLEAGWCVASNLREIPGPNGRTAAVVITISKYGFLDKPRAQNNDKGGLPQGLFPNTQDVVFLDPDTYTSAVTTEGFANGTFKVTQNVSAELAKEIIGSSIGQVWGNKNPHSYETTILYKMDGQNSKVLSLYHDNKSDLKHPIVCNERENDNE